jgi:class 3 adenylate cyclase
MTMAEIAAHISAQGDAIERSNERDRGEVSRMPDRSPAPPTAPSALPNIVPLDPERRALQLSIDDIPHPAYMVNHNFEVVWFNDLARQRLLGKFKALASRTESRNVFMMLIEGSAGRPAGYRRDLLGLHLSIAKERLSKASIMGACRDLSSEHAALMDSLYTEAEGSGGHAIVESPLELRDESADAGIWRVYATYYREGILFVYVPGGSVSSALLEFLSRRDVVIKNLLRRRLPVLTQLAVLVADLQNSVKICSELPPEEYFELINEIWSGMCPIFRKYYSSHGKHVGDGMVYYFFPQPDSNYIFNALACAQELRLAMKKISKSWQLRKNWFNELYLNIGLQEGQEWLGTFQSETNVEFAVLGDTINHAARLSDFARFGAVWATKNFVSKLTPEERARVEFGINRRNEGDREHFVASSYSQLGSLVDLDLERYEKLRVIATLSITEIRSVKLED